MIEKEYQRYGRNKQTLINNTYIESGEYRRKFDLTGNEHVNRILYTKAKEILKHRSGTLFEDMYWINGDMGDVVACITNSQEEERVRYTPSVRRAIQGRTDLIALHNHPNSMPPSTPDFNSVCQNKYRFGLVICHNGRVFQYKSEKLIHEGLVNIYIANYLKMGYTEYEAQLKALQDLCKQGEIEFEEVSP